MTTPPKLRDKLRKIEALFVGAGTAGERIAAEAALERVRAKLLELERRDPAAEMQFSMPDGCSICSWRCVAATGSGLIGIAGNDGRP